MTCIHYMQAFYIFPKPKEMEFARTKGKEKALICLMDCLTGTAQLVFIRYWTSVVRPKPSDDFAKTWWYSWRSCARVSICSLFKCTELLTNRSCKCSGSWAFLGFSGSNERLCLTMFTQPLSSLSVYDSQMPIICPKGSPLGPNDHGGSEFRYALLR